MFSHTPLRVQHVADIHDIQAQLDAMFSVTNFEFEVFAPTEVELVNLRSTCAISFCVLALMVLQVAILVYIVPESNTVSFCLELDFVIVSRGVHQIIAVAVAVDVVCIHIAISVWRITTVEQTQMSSAKQTFMSERNVPVNRTDQFVRNNIL